MLPQNILFHNMATSIVKQIAIAPSRTKGGRDGRERTRRPAGCRWTKDGWGDGGVSVGENVVVDSANVEGSGIGEAEDAEGDSSKVTVFRSVSPEVALEEDLLSSAVDSSGT